MNKLIHKHEVELAKMMAKAMPTFNKEEFLGTLVTLRSENEKDNRDSSELHRDYINR